jgi:hypothetical protein
MKYIARFYKVVSFALLAIDVFMVMLVIVSLLTRGRIVQYVGKYPKDIDSHDFYRTIPFGEIIIMILVSLWILLTVALAIDRRLSLKSTSFIVGIIGFIAAIIYIQLDPFGYGRYYFD